MTARYETPRTDVVDHVLDAVGRAVYLEQHATMSDGTARVMAEMVRPTVEATLTALRAIAYGPDGFCLLDGMAQATVLTERRAADDRDLTPEPPEWAAIDLRVGQAVVDMTLDRLALLPVDPRP